MVQCEGSGADVLKKHFEFPFCQPKRTKNPGKPVTINKHGMTYRQNMGSEAPLGLYSQKQKRAPNRKEVTLHWFVVIHPDEGKIRMLHFYYHLMNDKEVRTRFAGMSPTK